VRVRWAALLLGGLAVQLCVAPGASSQGIGERFVRLAADGAGVSALREPFRGSLDSLTVAEALRRLADDGGLGIAFRSDLPELARPALLDTAGRSRAQLILALIDGTDLEAFVSPRGQIVLGRPGVLPPERLAPPVVLGQVRDASGLPVMAALVSALDDRDDLAATVLTGSDGRFMIEGLEPGGYRLLVDVIGFAQVPSARFELRGGERRIETLTLALEPVRLGGLEVETERRCGAEVSDGPTLARLWAEAREAVQRTVVDARASAYEFEVQRYRRIIGFVGGGLEEMDRTDWRRAVRPFVSLDAEELTREGFRREAGRREADTYYAPDADVLLSDDFLEQHCFQVVEGAGEEEGLLGLSFEPVDPEARADVRGTLWMDPATVELRWLKFRYVLPEMPNAPQLLGGRVTFGALPDGTWYAREWSLVLPRVGRTFREQLDRATQILGVVEEGGRTLTVREMDGDTVLAADQAVLMGVVLARDGETPVPGVRVSLMGWRSNAVTDAHGRFRIGGLPDAELKIVFRSPELDALGATPLVVREVRRGHATFVRQVTPLAPPPRSEGGR